MAGVIVRKVENERNFKSGDMKVFFEFPWTVYKDDPNWVPPLLSTRQKLLDKGKNPSWEYMHGEYFIAWRGDKPVGIIAAAVNDRHNEFWEEKLGFFGFFECLDDQEAATALLQAASDYVKGQGMTALRGPANMTMLDECGMLIENFSRPVILMAYNPPYYQKLVEQSGLGFAKAMDVENWYVNPEMFAGKDFNSPPEKVLRVVEKTKKAKGISIRRPDTKKLKEELRLLRTIYENAWEKNWGFVPPTDHEMDHLFADLKDYFDPRIARFAEVHGKPVSFVLGLPDMNQVLHKAYPRPGESEIWTMIKALWYWKIRPVITGQRILLFGVLPEARRIGIESALIVDIFQAIRETPFWDNDCGWFLETNQPILALAELVRAKQYRRYRFFQREV
jgi:hypothetical protein